jgi:hypothetical protein
MSLGQPLDVFEDLSIPMIMVPHHSVKRVGPKSSCKYDGETSYLPTYPHRIGKKRRVKLTVVKGEEQP